VIYEVKQGWGPLCEFLGVAAPEGKAFRHLDDAEVFRVRIRWMRTLSVAVPAVAALAAALTGIAMMSYRAQERT
jgi:sulfotransferase family protein